MTDFNSACGWLLQFEDSHLSFFGKAMIEIIEADLGVKTWTQLPQWPQDTPQPIDIEGKIQRYEDFTENFSQDPLEFPEAMVRLAYYYLRKENPGEALSVLERAEKAYQALSKGDIAEIVNLKFMLAVVDWLKGCTALRMFNTRMAYKYWEASIFSFGEIAKNEDSQYSTDEAAFCGVQLKNMLVDLICLPEEAFSWLDSNKYGWVESFGGENRLNEPTRQLKDVLEELLGKSDLTGINAELQNFRQVSMESVYSLNPALNYGEADALLVTGMWLLSMGNVDQARKAIDQASSKFLPDTHPRAISYWLLGIAYWRRPVKKTEAVKYWQWAIQVFKKLQYQADMSRKEEARNWYRSQIVFMRCALEKKITEEFS